LRLSWRGRAGFEPLPTHTRFMSPLNCFGLGGILGIFQGQGEQAAQGVTAAHRRMQLALQPGGVAVDPFQQFLCQQQRLERAGSSRLGLGISTTVVEFTKACLVWVVLLIPQGQQQNGRYAHQSGKRIRWPMVRLAPIGSRSRLAITSARSRQAVACACETHRLARAEATK
jgi:hypothetical protein